MNPAFRTYFQKQKPSPILNAIVDEYTFREIRFDARGTIRKDMPCRHVNSIDFFLAGQYTTVDLGSQQALPFARSTIRGPRTRRKYRIEIDQDFICFSIRFKPTGIFKLLGIPMHEFADEAVDSMLVMPELFRSLTDKLLACSDLRSCVAVTEHALINQLKKCIPASPSYVTALADLIRLKDTSQRLVDLYRKIPLSNRQLERTFMNEVGVSPKTYHSLIRFENAMHARKDHPDEKWSSIAYDLHYFDQMHLVKDFKKFLGIRPSDFRPGDFAL